MLPYSLPPESALPVAEPVGDEVIPVAIPRAPAASGQQVELPFGEAPEDPTDLRRGAHELIVAVHVMHPSAELFDAIAVRGALDDVINIA